MQWLLPGSTYMYFDLEAAVSWLYHTFTAQQDNVLQLRGTLAYNRSSHCTCQNQGKAGLARIHCYLVTSTLAHNYTCTCMYTLVQRSTGDPGAPLLCAWSQDTHANVNSRPGARLFIAGSIHFSTDAANAHTYVHYSQLLHTPFRSLHRGKHNCQDSSLQLSSPLQQTYVRQGGWNALHSGLMDTAAHVNM